jgi:hypothetical protein
MIRLLPLLAVLGAVAVATAQQQPPQTASPPPAEQTTTPPTPAGGSLTRIPLQREVFRYSDRGRRDPMVSLMNSEDLRPLLQDLVLIGLIYDAGGRNSQATFKDLTDATKIYRVRVGQTIGRLTVSQITARDVEFTIEEFGFSRRERLPLKPDTTATRTP